LYRLAFRYTGNHYDAEDLAQETLLAAYRSFHQLRNPKRFRGWLFAILRNGFLKTKKRLERLHSTPLEEDRREYLDVLEAAASQYTAEELYAMVSESRHIQQSVAGLPEKYQKVILLRFTEGMTYQEISNAIGIPLGTVMSRLSRGKLMLKRKLLKQALRDSR
jgi:RNA polymerase sigma-70 factor (ECF subfamily)